MLLKTGLVKRWEHASQTIDRKPLIKVVNITSTYYLPVVTQQCELFSTG